MQIFYDSLLKYNIFYRQGVEGMFPRFFSAFQIICVCIHFEVYILMVYLLPEWLYHNILCGVRVFKHNFLLLSDCELMQLMYKF